MGKIPLQMTQPNMWGGCREAGCEAWGTAWEEIVWGTGAMCRCLVYYFRALRATMLFFGTSPLKKDKGQKTPAPSVGVALFPHTWCWEMREYPCLTSLLPGTWLQRPTTRRSHNYMLLPLYMKGFEVVMGITLWFEVEILYSAVARARRRISDADSWQKLRHEADWSGQPPSTPKDASTVTTSNKDNRVHDA